MTGGTSRTHPGVGRETSGVSEGFDTGGTAAAGPRELRIGDAERQSVIDQLRIHTGAGRLTLDEFSERADAVWKATTASELAPLLADLPAPRPDGVAPPPTAHAQPPQTQAQPAAPPVAPQWGSQGQSSLVAIMSGTSRRGRWEVAPELSAFAMWGNVKIDLRQAIIRSPVVDIRATVLMGGIDVIVPEGIPVEVSGMVLMGGCHNRVRGELAMPGAPLVRIHAGGLWGGIHVRSKPNPKAGAEPDEDDRFDHLHHIQDRIDDKIERHMDRLDRHMERFERMDGRGRPPRQPRAPRMPPREWAPAGVPIPVPPPFPSNRPDARPVEDAPPGRAPSAVPLDLPEGTLTMLFTDIVDSTSKAERLYLTLPPSSCSSRSPRRRAPSSACVNRSRFEPSTVSFRRYCSPQTPSELRKNAICVPIATSAPT